MFICLDEADAPCCSHANLIGPLTYRFAAANPADTMRYE